MIWLTKKNFVKHFENLPQHLSEKFVGNNLSITDIALRNCDLSIIGIDQSIFEIIDCLRLNFFPRGWKFFSCFYTVFWRRIQICNQFFSIRSSFLATGILIFLKIYVNYFCRTPPQLRKRLILTTEFHSKISMVTFFHKKSDTWVPNRWGI